MSSSAINTAGSNLLAYLTHEIGQLQAECRRKHPEIREVRMAKVYMPINPSGRRKH